MTENDRLQKTFSENCHWRAADFLYRSREQRPGSLLQGPEHRRCRSDAAAGAGVRQIVGPDSLFAKGVLARNVAFWGQ